MWNTFGLSEHVWTTITIECFPKHGGSTAKLTARLRTLLFDEGRRDTGERRSRSRFAARGGDRGSSRRLLRLSSSLERPPLRGPCCADRLDVESDKASVDELLLLSLLALR